MLRFMHQALVVEEEPVGVPPEDLHRLAVLGEEHEHIAGHRRERGLGLDEGEEGVDALAHAHRVLAHEVPAVAF